MAVWCILTLLSVGLAMYQLGYTNGKIDTLKDVQKIQERALKVLGRMDGDYL